MQTQDQDFLLWGHSLEEYRQMFDLTEVDLNKKILDCASGFASFNAEVHAQGKQVISADKAHDLPMNELRKFMNTGLQNMLRKAEKNNEQYIWKEFKSIADLKNRSERMINVFFTDFPQGKKEERYVAATLPQLPFIDNQFNLALCAYFLFSCQQSMQFHVDAIKEMCRVAGECRIYPLLDETGNPADILAPVILTLQQNNYGIEIKQVPYEFQKGANAMLRVWSQACEV